MKRRGRRRIGIGKGSKKKKLKEPSELHNYKKLYSVFKRNEKKYAVIGASLFSSIFSNDLRALILILLNNKPQFNILSLTNEVNKLMKETKEQEFDYKSVFYHIQILEILEIVEIERKGNKNIIKKGKNFKPMYILLGEKKLPLFEPE